MICLGRCAVVVGDVLAVAAHGDVRHRHLDAIHHAAALASAHVGHAVELAVLAEHEFVHVRPRPALDADALAFEIHKWGDRSAGRHLEQDTPVVVSALVHRAVEEAVGGCEQGADRIGPACRSSSAGEVHERRDIPRWGRLEDRAEVVQAAVIRQSIERTIRPEGQATPGPATAILARSSQGEVYQHGHRVGLRVEFEDGSFVVGAAGVGHAIEDAVGAESQCSDGPGTGVAATASGKLDQGGQLTSQRHSENGAVVTRAATIAHAVEMPVWTLHEPR